MSTYFITAIDTDAGKTLVTGLLGRFLKDNGRNVITMKLSQTGCAKYSEDIELHRKLMRISMLPVDTNGTTCPYVFRLAASPHLSAKMEGVKIEEQVIYNKLVTIQQRFDDVLLEGVGGLMVPLNEDFMVIDFIEKYKYPVILVTSGKLGSINHTLLSLEALYRRNIPLYGIVYNHFPVFDELITADSLNMIRDKVKKYYPKVLWAEVPSAEKLVNVKLDLVDDWFLY